MRSALRLVALLVLLTCAAATAQPKEDLTVWPNSRSRANSDDWILQNHDRIRRMRPRLLVLNFVNGLKPDAARAKAEKLIEVLRESSRYHGYRDPKAPAFLDYQVDKLVDLTDATPPAEKLDGNSTKYPRVPNWKEGINFQYSQLFGLKFAEYYGYPDPKQLGHFLTLAQLVNQGIIHEVWFLALQGKYGAPYESIEVKQAYGPDLRKLPGKWVQAGNGGDEGQPFIGRSLRILFINAERGPGCAMESLSHSMEGTANSNAIPYFRRYFYEYAQFDMEKRFKLPFKSLYERPGDVRYPTPTTMVYKDPSGKDVEIPDYWVTGGSVHFPPNARRDYDMDNTEPVVSTIEDWRCGSDHGKDRRTEWTPSTFAKYREFAPDCMGPWLVYWRQNMPGYGNHSRDDQGRPMKNWWPFLFY